MYEELNRRGVCIKIIGRKTDERGQRWQEITTGDAHKMLHVNAWERTDEDIGN